ncbi:MAG TPA: HYR domain-containing protein [Thermoanaerobaculia bacterium]|jgi:hypothetical protein
MARRSFFALVLIALATTSAAQTVQSGSGANAAAITPTRDAFRTDLGGGTTAGANGSFGGVRREINWDGVPAAQAAPNNLAANFFNVNSPRGVVFSTAGTGFQVSGATTDAGAGQPAAANFGNIDPTYTATFQQFSPQRLFTPLGSNVMDVNFFVAGTTTPALTTGFGAVFSDVDLASTTSIQYFDASNASLGTFFVPAFAGGFSFLGVSFPTAVVSRVRITTGNAALAAGTLDGASDLVVMDDFLYGEPAAAPACTVTCPANITVSNDPNQCGAVVTYPAATTTGSCGTINASPASGSFFPVGDTTVTVTSTAGPSCSFIVTVNDTQSPAITCPADITAPATSTSGATVNYTTPASSDNCPGVGPVTCAPASGSTFAIGNNTVTCMATDGAGNIGTCSFAVNVTAPANVPTLSEWLLIALGAMIGFIGVLRLRLS